MFALVCLSLGLSAAATTQCATADLAPLGLAPIPQHCDTPNCLVEFGGYQWWTAFQYKGNGSYFPGGTYYYNDGLRTIFAPQNVFVTDRGMHLQIAPQELGGGYVVAGAEAVLMFHSDGTPANLGYGTYLVSVHASSSFAALDANAVFAAYTYERVGNGTWPSGGLNGWRELDLAEISRWGWNQTGTCPYVGPVDSRLCTGNAQYTLQPSDPVPNLHRYKITPNVNDITLVMEWFGEKMPVRFRQFDGTYTLSSLSRATAQNTWTTSADQDQYIPATFCERFHLNMWLGNYAEGAGDPNPPTKVLPYEVVVTNFQFQPAV